MKTIQQVTDRITALEARAKDEIDVNESLETLEEIKVLMEDIKDPLDLISVLKENGASWIHAEYYTSAWIYLWALE